MSGNVNENLSALMDDATDEKTIRSLLNDQQLQDKWSRYHLVKDILHDDVPSQLDVSLAERISASIKDEPTLLVPSVIINTDTKPKPWLRQVAGLAIAASVTAFSIVLYPFLVNENLPANVAEQPKTAPIVADNPPLVNNSPALRASRDQSRANRGQNQPPIFLLNSREDERLNQLLWQHAESASEQGVNGFMPYVKVIAYPVKQKVEEEKKIK
ncbi:MAG: sigma-E factor negative regulatory protein [Pseudomonadota bacterium]